MMGRLRTLCMQIAQALEILPYNHINTMYKRVMVGIYSIRRDVPVCVPLDLSTPTGMSCIGAYGENCKSDNVSK